MSRLAWLTARPVAHRGLHDASAGIIENTRSAFAAAFAGGFSIECDVQLSADGEAMVHHDHELGRLTEGSGPLAGMTAAALRGVRFKDTADAMMTLDELCALAAGRETLVIEMKSRFDGDLRLPARVAETLASYSGPAAVMSFDPDLIVELRRIAPALTRGIVFERHYTDHEWDRLDAGQKNSMAHLLHGWRSRPHFLAFRVKDFPATAPLVARNVFGLPLLTWTVRTAEDRATASRYADQMIFEGFRP